MPWVIGYVGDVRDLHWGMATSAIAPLLMVPLVMLLLGGGARKLKSIAK
jgi:hypothetical protein